MAVFFLVVALLSACWGAIAYWLAETHPTPSQSSLIPQFVASVMVFVAALLCAAVFAIYSLFGG